MHWLWYGVLAGMFWGMTDVLLRIFSHKTEALMGVLLFSLGMLLAIFVITLSFGKFDMTIFTRQENWPVVGIFLVIGLVNVVGYAFFFSFFQAGGNLTQGIPLITLMITLTAVLIGIVLLKDPFTWRIALGIVLALTAVYLLK